LEARDMGLGSLLKKGLGALGGVSPAIGIGASLLGGLFGAKSKKKTAEAQRKADIEGLNLKQNMAEDKRLGNVNAGASLLQSLAGKGFTGISPEALAALQQRRTYDFSKAVPEAGAGMGSGLLSGLFGGIQDIASRAGIEQDAPMSPGQPNVPTQEVPGVPDLRSRVGEFDTGIDYRLDPYGRG